MLKWTSKSKYGGSHPEGLDRIDSASVPMRHTQSCKIVKNARSNPSSPRSRKNNIINRSTSEIFDRRSSMETIEQQLTTTPTDRRQVKSLVLENLSSPAVNSPFVSLQWEELYKRFENAHSNFSTSSQSPSPSLHSDDDVSICSTPKSSRQTSTNSMRRNSPANLPSIEEAAENDELLSIADSGICDEDYDHKKHYFEPCKFHDDTANNTNNNNEANFKRYNPCNRSLSLPAMKSNFYTNNNNNNDNNKKTPNTVEYNKQISHKSDSSSDESDNQSPLSFDCLTSTKDNKATDIDRKNEELYSRLRADLENTGLGKSNSDDENDISHSLM